MLRAGLAPATALVRSQACKALTPPEQNGASSTNRTWNPTFAKSCDICFTNEAFNKMVRHAGAAPARAAWKAAMRADTSMTQKWWLEPVSRRRLGIFSAALICLSYPAMVLPHGAAPWSPTYQAGALLLSYGRKRARKDERKDRRSCQRRVTLPRGRPYDGRRRLPHAGIGSGGG